MNTLTCNIVNSISDRGWSSAPTFMRIFPTWALTVSNVIKSFCAIATQILVQLPLLVD
ncbi:hypothetical protein [Calothrix sp. UHCC 0171]|uniref:hypothetical protein n=1 Tax=Calothrix sp. UHCC 0171 TaxID=3110245 RepID=UPI002B1F02CF|nr:hypothetical protein [Calothrix sp. UHCC 0171]MEA5574500.1 hypothetical protein [Calothrix sp. UHCC 0171]